MGKPFSLASSAAPGTGSTALGAWLYPMPSCDSSPGLSSVTTGVLSPNTPGCNSVPMTGSGGNSCRSLSISTPGCVHVCSGNAVLNWLDSRRALLDLQIGSWELLLPEAHASEGALSSPGRYSTAPQRQAPRYLTLSEKSVASGRATSSTSNQIISTS